MKTELKSSTADSVLPNKAAAMSAVVRLLPEIRARAEETEANHQVSTEVIQSLLASGLFDVVKPECFGGSNLGFETLVDVTIELASACGSTGWVYGVLAGHSWLLNLFPIEAQREVFTNQNALTATVFRLAASVTPEEGGYKMENGEGRFCSGIDHADFVLVGSAVQREGKPPEPRFFVIPKDEVEVIDDWQTTGMRGTGSKSIRIAESFIPEHRSCALSDMLTGTSPGAEFHQQPIYKLPFSDIAPFSIVGAPLGMAKGALQHYMNGVSPRLLASNEQQQAAQFGSLARYAGASAALDASILLVLRDAAKLDKLIGPDDEFLAERAKIPRNWSFAVQSARDSVNDLFSMAGGSSIYNTSAIQRCWRDVNSSAQHIAFGWDSAMTKYGKVVAGLDTDDFSIPPSKA
jgi:alkylation response protein AidB-like acyl-CoA dehydrogenase